MSETNFTRRVIEQSQSVPKPVAGVLAFLLYFPIYMVLGHAAFLLLGYPLSSPEPVFEHDGAWLLPLMMIVSMPISLCVYGYLTGGRGRTVVKRSAVMVLRMTPGMLGFGLGLTGLLGLVVSLGVAFVRISVEKPVSDDFGLALIVFFVMMLVGGVLMEIGEAVGPMEAEE